MACVFTASWVSCCWVLPMASAYHRHGLEVAPERRVLGAPLPFAPLVERQGVLLVLGPRGGPARWASSTRRSSYRWSAAANPARKRASNSSRSASSTAGWSSARMRWTSGAGGAAKRPPSQPSPRTRPASRQGPTRVVPEDRQRPGPGPHPPRVQRAHRFAPLRQLRLARGAPPGAWVLSSARTSGVSSS